MKYRDGYSKVLTEEFRVDTFMPNPKRVETDFIIYDYGVLTLKKGYAWDGATFFPDIPSVVKASAVHDGLYQLIFLKELPESERLSADNVFRRICTESGMNPVLAWTVWLAVRIFGKSHIYRESHPEKNA